MSARLLLLLLLPTLLPAQMHITARFGVADHGGHAENAADADQPTFGPGTSRDGTLALGLDRGAWRLALTLRRETPDLVLVGASSGIITRNALAAWHGGAELGRRILGSRDAPQLHVLLGVGVTQWSFPGFEDPARSRLAGTLALEGALGLSGPWHGVLRLEGEAGAGLFDRDDLPEGYQPLGARRIGLSLGVRWHR
jgi:hypothetical protein